METQPQVSDGPNITRQHVSGEVFEAHDLEAARGMCPVLGKMSLEEAGLLLELEALGKEQMTEQQNTRIEKPVIEKVEKEQPQPLVANTLPKAVHTEPEKRPVPEVELTECRLPETTAEAVNYLRNEPQAAEMQEPIIRQSETVPLARNINETSEATPAVSDEAQSVEVREAMPPIKLSEQSEPIQNPRVAVEIIEKVRFLEERVRTISATTGSEVTEAVRTNEIETIDLGIRHASEAAVTDGRPKPFDVEQPAGSTEQDAGLEDLPLFDEHVHETREDTIEPVLADLDEVEVVDSAYSILEIHEAASPMAAYELESFEASESDEMPPIEVSSIILQTDAEPFIFPPHESQPMVAAPELPTPAVYIEAAIVELIDVIERADTPEPEKVQEILTEIITLPDKIESAPDEEPEALDQKLEELFVELFETAGIHYTPELISSFVKLTQVHYLENVLAVVLKPGEKEMVLPVEVGTREFLQKLQKGLGAVKDAVIGVYELGKSILRVYAYGVASRTLELA